jgi:hypothetical protein
VSNSTGCFPLFVIATILNCDFKYVSSDYVSHYESYYVLDADSTVFNTVTFLNVSSHGNSLNNVWNVECFVTRMFVIIFSRVCEI